MIWGEKMLKTEGIVLNELRFKETSKILNIYTKKFGKISVIAQGAYRPKSKLIANTQPFSYCNYQLQKGRNFYYLSEGDLLNSFYSIRDNMYRIIYGFYMLELLDKSTPEGEENVRLFSLLAKGLDVLSNIDKDYLKFITAYELKFISFLGYRPFLDNCVICNNKLNVKNKFSILHGGIICENCFSHDYHAKYIDSNFIRGINDLLYISLDNLDNVTIAANTLIMIHDRLVKYILYNIDRQGFKSLDILNSILDR